MFTLASYESPHSLRCHWQQDDEDGEHNDGLKRSLFHHNCQVSKMSLSSPVAI